MSSIVGKTTSTLLRPLLPYLRLVPRPLLTLPPVLALHITSNPASTTPISFLLDPLSHPTHLPLLLTLCLIPVTYAAGLISGNVSWVDRSWPIYTPLCSALVILWGCLNPAAGIHGHNLPRLMCMMFLQIVWSHRLIRHAIRRDFYDLTSEDYRYAQFRKTVPNWLFQLVHPIVIATAQPLLLFSLCLPLHAVLVAPPTELSSGPLSTLSIPYSALLQLLPARFHSASPSTPILNIADLALIFIGLGLVAIEAKADGEMFKYQTSKHSSKSKDIVHPPKLTNSKINGPSPKPYPRSHHPGFITTGMWKWSRHPNFMAEQLFWVNQALFVVAAGRSSGVSRSGWVGGAVFGPCFALSLLFCASTFLTEWITGRKYPAYATYKRLVGQFLPQETALVWLWTSIVGGREAARKAVYYQPPK